MRELYKVKVFTSRLSNHAFSHLTDVPRLQRKRSEHQPSSNKSFQNYFWRQSERQYYLLMYAVTLVGCLEWILLVGAEPMLRAGAANGGKSAVTASFPQCTSCKKANTTCVNEGKQEVSRT